MKKHLLIAFVFLPAFAFAEMPAFPMAFWGSATVDGVAVPSGSIIRVYDDSIKVGEVQVQEAGVYGYTEPTKQKLVVSEAVGTLTFTIQASSINGGVEVEGITPVTHAGFVSGETLQKSLDFDIAPTVVVTSGGSSSGGGGGGSSKKKVEPPKELVLGIASTTLSEPEQKIILQKQLIELLTLLISLLKQKMLLGVM
jgi:hypothetical protein